MCSSPTHDAIGAFGGMLALSLMTDQTIRPAGLLVLVGCTATMGLAETRASLRCRREEEPLKVPRAALRAELRLKGVPREQINEEVAGRFPRPRWHGPPKRTRRKLRLIALAAAVLSAWPVAVAYAASRLPDQLEVARIDHRKVTHWLLSTAVVLASLRFGLAEAGVSCTVVDAVVLFAGIGILGHLWADGITLAGVPFFGPFWRRDLHLLPKRLRVRTGGKADAVVMLAASAGTVWLALTMGGWT